MSPQSAVVQRQTAQSSVQSVFGLIGAADGAEVHEPVRPAAAPRLASVPQRIPVDRAPAAARAEASRFASAVDASSTGRPTAAELAAVDELFDQSARINRVLLQGLRILAAVALVLVYVYVLVGR